MVQIQFQMLEEAMDALKAAAARWGITPNILARLIMHELFILSDAESTLKVIPGLPGVVAFAKSNVNTGSVGEWKKEGGE